MKKILVVDDDLDLREILTETLKRKGYLVYSAENGIRALKILETETVDAILTDIHMPEMDGVEFLKVLHNRMSTIPVVLFMSESPNLSPEEAYDLGVFAILKKPYPQKLLFEVFSRIFMDAADMWKLRPPRYHDASQIELRLEGIEESISASLFNIGRGGAYIQSKTSFPKVESQVFFNIEFNLPKKITISGIGIVRWVRQESRPEMPSGFGIEFFFIDEPGRSQLTDILKNLHRQQFIPKV